MEKLQIEIIKKILMLSTKKELELVRDNGKIMDAIGRECDQDDHDQELFKQWKEDRSHVS